MATINVLVRDTGAGNAPMPNVYIVLYDVSNNTSTQVLTDINGQVNFTTMPAGSYSVYNTGIDTTGQNPPTQCGFPNGYTGTTTARRLDFALTVSGVGAANFFYDKPLPWSALNGGNPPNIGFTTTSQGINLATGALTPIPNISNNGMGYCTSDNMIYGQANARAITRSDARPGTALLTIPVTISGSTVIGDCDIYGHFYNPSVNNVSFTCLDVNPYRTTYLRPLNPYLNFQEIPVLPYTISYISATTGPADNDWAYVDNVKGLVEGASGSRMMWILSLTTPKAYNVPLVGFNHIGTGINMADLKNYYGPVGTGIRKYYMTTTIAIGTTLSTSTLGTTGDGCRAQSAAVFFANPVTLKKVDKSVAIKGETLIYTVTIVNKGVTTGNNAIFYDTIPDGLTFVPDSIFLDSVQQFGAVLSNVTIGTMALNQVFTVTFNALVSSDTILSFTNTSYTNNDYIDDATGEPYNTTYQSNNVTTTNILPYINTSKAVNKGFAIVGDELDYTIVVSNIGTNTALNCVLLDTTPLGTSFVSDSIQIDGITAPMGSNLFPIGLSLGTITSGQLVTVTFKNNIVSIPSTTVVNNSGVLNYNYKDTTRTIPLSNNTNITATSIVVGSLDGFTKAVDKVFASCGDILTYAITIPNSGNTTAYNVLLIDTIPNGTTYISGSAIVNGVVQPLDIDPQVGISVGTISVGGLSTVTFKVIVTC